MGTLRVAKRGLRWLVGGREMIVGIFEKDYTSKSPTLHLTCHWYFHDETTHIVILSRTPRRSTSPSNVFWQYVITFRDGE